MKKLISVLLALAILAALLPLTLSAGAEETATVTVDGVEYAAHVGDIIHYTYYLDLSGIDLGADGKAGCITEIEGRVYYDKAQLRLLTSIEPDDNDKIEALPVFKSGSVVTADEDERFFGYNAFKSTGYAFKSEKVLLKLDFEVTGSQPSSITHVIEVLNSGSTYLIDGDVICIQPKVRKVIDVECTHIAPTAAPTAAPTVAPTTAPTVKPTTAPTAAPTVAPTVKPTQAPTVKPTQAPTVKPTQAPTAAPTVAPTAKPTQAPTAAPTAAPTVKPTQAPTAKPTEPSYRLTDSSTGITVSTNVNAQLKTSVVDPKTLDFVLSDSEKNTIYDIELYQGGTQVQISNSTPATFTIPVENRNASVYYINYLNQPIKIAVSSYKGYDATQGKLQNYVTFKSSNSGKYVISDSGEPLKSYVIGDVDMDGAIMILDATMIQRYLADLDPFTPTQELLADYDRDGRVMILDATAIQRHLADLD